jgi:penicillin-binding protein 2
MKLRPEINRATQENYAPGSIFKVIVGLAALEAGLNPEKFTRAGDPEDPGTAVFTSASEDQGHRAAGQYNFKRAVMERSSNTYFITIGLQAGMNRIVALAEKFHFGERWNCRRGRKRAATCRRWSAFTRAGATATRRMCASARAKWR